METTINERLKLLIDGLSLNVNSFAKSLGKSNTSIHHVADGISKPGFALLELILIKYPQINEAWLMKGEGDMFKEGGPSSPAPAKSAMQRGIDYAQVAIDALKEQVAELKRDKDFLQEIIKSGNFQEGNPFSAEGHLRMAA